MVEPKKCDSVELGKLPLEIQVAVLAERLHRFEEKVRLQFEQVHEGFKSRDKALDLQALNNKEHFHALNHEAQRILKATEITVSRDTWIEFLKGYQEWRSSIDRAVQASVPREEFQSYKETTQTALMLKAGQAAGVGLSFSTIVQVIATMAAIAAVMAVMLTFRH